MELSKSMASSDVINAGHFDGSVPDCFEKKANKPMSLAGMDRINQV
jgi:hypothetical protein